jgi:glycosyltransferase involved in cell wall biosynthesis
VHIFGGSDTGDEKLEDSRVVFHPFLPHRELMKSLASAGVMVSLDEGLKMADYLSLGGAIVAPDLPSTREILGEAALYFSFGSAVSLAESLKRIKETPYLFQRLRETALARSNRYLWPHKAMKLKEFLEELATRKIRGVPPFPAVSGDLP